MAVVYALVSWGVAQVATTVQSTLLLPEWMPRLVVALLILGFPIALALAWLFDLSSVGLKREAPAPSATAPSPVPITAPQVSPAEESADNRRSIVVLPFSNLSDDSSNEFFSDGITEEILNLLARQSGLRVISRTTSFSFNANDAGHSQHPSPAPPMIKDKQILDICVFNPIGDHPAHTHRSAAGNRDRYCEKKTSLDQHTDGSSLFGVGVTGDTNPPRISTKPSGLSGSLSCVSIP